MMRPLPLVMVAVVTVSAGVLGAPAASQPAEVRAAAAAALRQRDYPAAIRHLDLALEQAPPAEREYLLYLRGTAQALAGDLPAAIATWKQQIADVPNGAWTTKARWAVAEALVKQKQFAEAVEVYRPLVVHLISPARRGELAEVYLDLADRLMFPESPLAKPDPAAAANLYASALELGLDEPLQDRIRYLSALAQFRAGNFSGAQEAFEAYLRTFDPVYRQRLLDQLGVRAGLPKAADKPGVYRLDARFHLGLCALRTGSMSDARERWEDLLKLLPRDPTTQAGDDAKAQVDELVKRQRELSDLLARQKSAGDPAALQTQADLRKVERQLRVIRSAVRSPSAIEEDVAYNLPATYGLPAPASDLAMYRGIALLKAYLAKFPTSGRAPQAAFDIAAALRARGRTDDAIAAFQAVIDRQGFRVPAGAEPGVRTAEEVRQMAELADRLAMEATYNIGQLQFDARRYEAAVGTWTQYTRKFPNGPQWSAAQAGIVNAEYAIGQVLREERQLEKARQSWEAFLVQHPLDERAASILWAFGQMRVQQADECRNPDPAQRRNVAAGRDAASYLREAVEDWQRLIQKYPGSSEASHAQLSIGVLYEEKLDNLEKAMEAYEAVQGVAQGEARQRMSRLSTPALTVRTARTFRSTETPAVILETRNIDKVTVKAYRLDMEAYFRKSHTIRQVEALAIALIDPDVQWDVPVANYQRYRPIRSDVALAAPATQPAASQPVTVIGVADKLKGPGVWVLNIGTDQLEATTLVVQSDIDLVYKASRKGLLVFAQDMVKQAPAEGVEVLASDGKGVFVSGKTGPDGVWQVTAGKDRATALPNAELLSVFARRGPDVAGNLLSLGGLGASTGLQPRGLVFTDRPAYQPAQTVRVAGILRLVEAGQYRVPENPKDRRQAWRLAVADPQGRVIRDDVLTLSDFGTAAAKFDLPANAPVGGYNLTISKPGGPSFTGQFTVATYQLKPIRLAFDLPQRVVLRGEPLKGRIKASYYTGQPLPGKLVEYQLGDGRQRQAVTDKDGAIAFELDTSLFAEEQTLGLAARLTEDNVSASGLAYVAVKPFTASVRLVRDLYLADEPFEATVSTSDPAGKPVGQELEVQLLRLANDTRGAISEVEVEKKAVKTDPATGQARVTFKTAKGGAYLVRARQKDVVADARLFISDADDATRLRLLTEKESYKVGDELTAQVVWRLDPRLALVTFEGEDVLSYQTLQLKKGVNDLPIKLGDQHFPNVNVSAAVMAGPSDADGPNRFYEAGRELQVSRELRVTLTPDKKELAPRGTVSVQIKTTDQQGRPVAAEVMLGMVDASLLSLFADGTPAIVPFFNDGARRVAAMRTGSTASFSYAPPTRAVSRALLAEARRLTEEAEDEKSAEKAPQLAMMNPAMQPAEPQGQVTFNSGGVRVTGEVEGRPGMAVSSGGPSAPRSVYFGRAGAPTDSLSAVDGPMPVPVARERAGRQSGSTGAMGHGGPPAATAISGQFGYAAPAAPASQPAGYATIAGGGRGVARHAGDAQRALNGSDWELAERSVTLEAHDLAQLANAPAMGNERQFQQVTWALQGSAEATRLGDVQMSANGWAEVLQRGALVLNDLADGSADDRSLLLEVAYWNPAIKTGPDGLTTVSFPVPDNITEWKLTARGVSQSSLVGQADASVVTRKDFYVSLNVPAALVEGDKLAVRGRVHHLGDYVGPIECVLTVSGGGAPRELRQTLNVVGPGVDEITFEAVDVQSAAASAPAGSQPAAVAPAQVQFALTANAGAPGARLSDTVRQSVPVQPYGYEQVVSVSGRGGDRVLRTLTWPQADLADRSLVIQIGPDLKRWLLDEALSGGIVPLERSAAGCSIPPYLPSTAAAAGQLLGCLKVADYLAGTAADSAAPGQVVNPDAQRLRDHAATLVAQLSAAQNEQGWWGWNTTQFQGEGRADAQTTVLCIWALATAQKARLVVPPQVLERATAWVTNRFSQVDMSDYNAKAELLAAMAWLGKGDFSVANRLVRDRPRLSAYAVGMLALALVEMDRPELAREVLDGTSLVAVPGLTPAADRPAVQMLKADRAGEVSPIETNALLCLALQKANPASPAIDPVVKYLESQRSAGGWYPPRSRGAILAALAAWYGKTQPARADFRLVVRVNEQVVATLPFDQKSGMATVAVPAGVLTGKVETVDLQADAKAEYLYIVSGSGFSRTFPAPPRDLQDLGFNKKVRQYSPLPPRFAGRPVPVGFSTVNVRSDEYFVNTLTQVPIGQVADVELNAYRYHRNRVDRDWLVVQDTIPAGTALVPGSVQGSFDQFTQVGNRLTFLYGPERHPGQIRYQVIGQQAGDFRVIPAVIRSLNQPEYLAFSAEQRFGVLPADQKGKDPYTPTPDELYYLGKGYFEAGQMDEAMARLEPLFAKWKLADDPYRQTARMLLYGYLARGDDANIVRIFEVLKERYADLEIPFDQIVRVAQAYTAIGEHERAYLVYRATAESSFVRDAQVAGVLDRNNRFLESIDFLADLWRRYPDIGEVVSTYYALSQSLLSRTPQAASVQPRVSALAAGAAEDPARRTFVTARDLRLEAQALLYRFLTLYPAHPLADQAAYSLANTELELEQFAIAIRLAEQFARTFEKSSYLDRFNYIQALGYFNTDQFDKALELADRVAQATTPDAAGLPQPSPNRWLAQYIMGQIWDARGQPAKAMTYYQLVKDRFGDAAEAIRVFEAKKIVLPEATVYHPFAAPGGGRQFARGSDLAINKPAIRVCAKPTVAVAYKNIAQANLQVFKVDLMKLMLLEKNLANITGVNLAGIAPTFQATVPLGDGKTYVDEYREIELPIAEEGAYLVICRGDDLFTSGLVLITPLALQVDDQDAPNGRVRLAVQDVSVQAAERLAELAAKAEPGTLPLAAFALAPAKRTHVKLIGSGDPDFTSGETDLRGVFTADGLDGRLTAISRDQQNRYAFFRGTTWLGTPPTVDRGVPRAPPARPTGGKSSSSLQPADYQKELRDENLKFNKDQGEQLRRLYDAKPASGVQVQQAK